MAGAEEDPRLKSTKAMIRSVLMSVKEGVLASRFLSDYKDFTGETVPFKQLGFSSLGDFFKSIPDVVFAKPVNGQLTYFAVADEATQHIQKLIQRQKTNIKKGRALKKGLSRFPKYHSQVGRSAAFHGGNRPGPPPRPPMRVSGFAHARPITGFKTPLLQTPFSTSTMSPLTVTVRSRLGAGAERVIERGASGNGGKQMASTALRAAVKQQFQDKKTGGSNWNYEVPPRFQKQNAGSSGVGSSERPVAGAAKTASTKSPLNTCVNSSLEPNQSDICDEKKVVQPSPQNQKAKESQQEPAVAEEELPSGTKAWAATLLKDYQGGLWSSRFEVLYKEEFGQEPPSNLMEIVETWTDIARVEMNNVANRHVLYPVLEKKWQNFIVPIAQLFEEEMMTEVYASYSLDPNHFYLQDAESCAEEITATLNEIHEKLAVPKASDLQPGVFCAALYSEDESWYRARVLYLQSDKEVQVIFIDYGNVEKVSIDDIRCLTQETAETSAQAVGCVMFALKPFLADCGWSEEAKTTFHNMMNNQKLQAFTHKIEEGNCVVELWTEEGKTSLNEQLYEAKLVDTYLPRNIDPPELEVPEDGYIEVVVAFSDLVNCWLRRIGQEYSDRLEEFEDIKLSTLYKRAIELSKNFQEGSICIVHSELLYHRVRITEIKDRTANCFFVDHGYTEWLPLEQLAPLDADVNCSLPYQAVCFSLFGLEKYMNNPITITELVENTRTKICVVEIILREPLKVMLYDTDGTEDININEEIAKKLQAEGHSIDMTLFSPSTDTASEASGGSSPQPQTKDSPQQDEERLLAVTKRLTLSEEESLASDSSGVNTKIVKPLAREEASQKPSDDVVVNKEDSKSPQDAPPSPQTVVTESAAVASHAPAVTSRSIGMISPFSDSLCVAYNTWPLPSYIPKPEVGQFFDVYVQSVSDPSNFVIVQHNLLGKLEKMMEQLNALFSDEFAAVLQSDSSVQTPTSVPVPKASHLYMALVDGTYNRAIYIKATESMHHVFLPDFHQHHLIQPKDLFFLPKQFWSMPFVAFRACLHGVKPAGGKSERNWPESAKYKFSQLALHQSLVALLKEVHGAVDSSDGVDHVTQVPRQKLSLHLVNTADPHTDIIIGDALVAANLGVVVDN